MNIFSRIYHTITNRLNSLAGGGSTFQKAIVALVLKDVKAFGGKVEEVAAADIKALKSYAVETVKKIEADPEFAKALGELKFGVAFKRLEGAILAGVISHIPQLAKGTLQTLVQSAWAIVAAGLA